MGRVHGVYRRGTGKLENWIKTQTGDFFFTGQSPEHGVDVETPCLLGWCCQDDGNVWDEDGVPPPCEVCPRAGFQLTFHNERLIRVWKFLDMTGRDRMFDEGFLREEAVEVALNRYRMNSIRNYENLLYLDTMILEHRRKNKPKEKKQK